MMKYPTYNERGCILEIKFTNNFDYRWEGAVSPQAHILEMNVVQLHNLLEFT